MNYQNIYDKLIERSKNRIIDGYTERHHIIPKCLGGNNSKDNLVKLTPEEHYLAHQLLAKINPTHHGLIYAAMMMTRHTTDNRKNNKLFGWLRNKMKITRANQIFSQESIDKRLETKIKNGKLNHTNEAKKKISDAKMGKSLSDLHKDALSKNHWTKRSNADDIKLRMINCKIGFKHSEETKRKLSEARSGKKYNIVECPHCGKQGGSPAMHQWHFDNCKSIIVN